MWKSNEWQIKRYEAAKNHYHQWDWLANHPEFGKADYREALKAQGKTDASGSDCYLCDFVGKVLDSDCRECPGMEGHLIPFDAESFHSFSCLGGLYSSWKNAGSLSTRTMYAREIRDRVLHIYSPDPAKKVPLQPLEPQREVGELLPIPHYTCSTACGTHYFVMEHKMLKVLKRNKRAGFLVLVAYMNVDEAWDFLREYLSTVSLTDQEVGLRRRREEARAATVHGRMFSNEQ